MYDKIKLYLSDEDFMMSHVQDLQQQIDTLSPEELQEILTYLNHKLNQPDEFKTKIKWKDVRGFAPDLLGGEDAQMWVTKIRS
jgi:hypothetical protein